MHISAALYLTGALLLNAAAAHPMPGRMFVNLPVVSVSDVITDSATDPSVEEAAVKARRLVRDQSIGDLNTIYQHGRLKGSPIGLPEYYADCDKNGSLTLLLLGVGVNYDNWQAGSPVSFSIKYTPTFIPPISPATEPRVSLQGSITYIPEDDDAVINKAKFCFLRRHPDAKLWLPGNGFHNSSFARFDVESVYWIGGFGHKAYIGDIPVDLYHNVTLNHPRLNIPVSPPKHGDDDNDGKRKSWFGRLQLPFGSRRQDEKVGDYDADDKLPHRLQPRPHHMVRPRPCGRPQPPYSPVRLPRVPVAHGYYAPPRRLCCQQRRPLSESEDDFDDPGLEFYGSGRYEDYARAIWRRPPPSEEGRPPFHGLVVYSDLEPVEGPIEEPETFVNCGPRFREALAAYQACINDAHMELLSIRNGEDAAINMHDKLARCQLLRPTKCSGKQHYNVEPGVVQKNVYDGIERLEFVSDPEPEKSSWYEYIRGMFYR
ncbi:pyridoxamine 5'-phosphate oxidase-domain-containing protein [Lipomyces chichibuensis]|uniref:pyridoxamine 5'-phosphate oxidase-domain-containing protein n=1 Tax=Lipomyces chichibuensis TaxID=1546026 RepID=UPI00334364A6